MARKSKTKRHGHKASGPDLAARKTTHGEDTAVSGKHYQSVVENGIVEKQKYQSHNPLKKRKSKRDRGSTDHFRQAFSDVVGSVIGIIVGTIVLGIVWMAGMYFHSPVVGLGISACIAGLSGTGVQEMMSTSVTYMRFLLICSGFLALAILQLYFIVMRTGGTELIQGEETDFAL